MAEMIQLNTRIDRELKEAGDSALSLIGFNPSQAVRALWEKAARRGRDLEEVAELLSSAEERKLKEGAPTEAQDVIRQGWELMDDVYASLGVDLELEHDFPSDDDLLERALFERMAERDLT